jgi:DnaJ-class molecular chaperone
VTSIPKKKPIAHARMAMIQGLEEAPHHYALLNIHKDATEAELRTARYMLARALHPDHWGNEPRAADLMARVNTAYDTLIDPARLKKYRTVLFNKGSCTHCDAKGFTYKSKGFSERVKTICAHCEGSGAR